MDSIFCVGGLKYYGDIVDVSYTFFASMKWIKLKTKQGDIIINGDHIVSIMYGKGNRKENS